MWVWTRQHAFVMTNPSIGPVGLKIELFYKCLNYNLFETASTPLYEEKSNVYPRRQGVWLRATEHGRAFQWATICRGASPFSDAGAKSMKLRHLSPRAVEKYKLSWPDTENSLLCIQPTIYFEGSIRLLWNIRAICLRESLEGDMQEVQKVRWN